MEGFICLDLNNFCITVFINKSSPFKPKFCIFQSERLMVGLAMPSTSEGQAEGSNDTIVELPGHEAESQNNCRNFAEAINENTVEMR